MNLSGKIENGFSLLEQGSAVFRFSPTLSMREDILQSAHIFFLSTFQNSNKLLTYRWVNSLGKCSQLYIKDNSLALVWENQYLSIHHMNTHLASCMQKRNWAPHKSTEGLEDKSYGIMTFKLKNKSINFKSALLTNSFRDWLQKIREFWKLSLEDGIIFKIIPVSTLPTSYFNTVANPSCAFYGKSFLIYQICWAAS